MQHQSHPKTAIDQLAESLSATHKQVLVAIKEMNRDPNQAQLSWKDAIATHLKGQVKPALPNKPEEPPQSFSLDEDELVDWEELEEELGQGVIVLAQELGYSTAGKVSVSDAAVIREMLTLDSVHEALGEKIVAAEGLQQGFAEQYVQDQLEVGRAIAQAGSIALTTGFFEGKVNGLEQITELNQTLHDELLEKLTKDTVKVGTVGKGKANQTVMTLGKQAIAKNNTRKKKEPATKERFNLKNIRASAKK